MGVNDDILANRISPRGKVRCGLSSQLSPSVAELAQEFGLLYHPDFYREIDCVKAREVIELGLYESTLKIYKELTDQGIEPHSDQWKAEIECKLNRHKEAMHPRLFPEIPSHRYACFYPMDRRRGEDKNWYQLPIEERARQMNEHGLVGRRYAGEVRQIITGSIGFDDWEWGVDLFADDPLVFKKLIYEMRFDQVSAVHALFGHFYVGVRVAAASLDQLLNGVLPK